MASKTITVREEAYQALKKLQLDDESFSDTILRITKHFGTLEECWGTGTKTDQEYEQELHEINQRRQNFFEGRS